MSKTRFIETLSQWHLQHRLKEYEKYGARASGIKFRNKIHSFLLKFVTLDRVLSKRELHIIDDKHDKGEKPIIFAVTHIGGCDVESAFEAIKSPAWLLFGDPKEIYCIPTGLLLWFNGVVCVETRNKTDRRIAKERCVSILKDGGNILMFPEGAWNISPNQIVYHMYYGAVDMAMETNSQIVPVGIIRDKSNYYVNIGENINIADYGNNIKGLTYILRDIMGSLQWEIMERLPILHHSEIDSEYYHSWVNEIVDNQTATFSVEEVYETRFNPNYIIDYADAFEHLNHIKLNTNNAFLFDKRLHN
ncbi:MAG: 1-acyl-sn-glycerol-3-phosphate acyltransferase [Eubacterium sp.]|nr:1-acyl-sn-glycerol-3-phosphate acyltransferase [Eubacterium sp.]